MRAVRLFSALLLTSSEGQEARKGRCSPFGAKSGPVRTGSSRPRYSHRIPSIGRPAADGMAEASEASTADKAPDTDIGLFVLRVLQKKWRADERTRTADLLITSELLYLLSYVGKGLLINQSRHVPVNGKPT